MVHLSTGKKICFYGLIIIGIYLFCEIGAFGLYLIFRGETLPFSRAQADRLAILNRGPDNAETEMAEEAEEVIHPYLGYVRNPRKMPGHNEFGFPGERSPLAPPGDNEVIVGIFGGSFAEGLSEAGSNALIEELKRLPRFDNKEIIILTIAMGGYKQPQQLFTLAYLLSLGAHFDIVINIDGFNELVLPRHENIPKHVFPFYPRAWFLRVQTLPDPNLLLKLGEIALLKERRKEWALIFSSRPLAWSVIANLIWQSRDRHLAGREARAIVALQEAEGAGAEGIGYLTTGPNFQVKNKYESFARYWEQCSILMDQLCRANGIAYFHFLQPNQHLPGSKIITPEEAAVALWGAHSVYRRSVEKGYPLLRRYGENLVERGLQFHDLTMIFKETEKPLYIDNCCHVSEEGYRIIGSRIGAEIAKALTPRENR